jgi:hypothetical protein
MHLGRITKLVKEALAFVPGQTEGADVGYAKTSYDIAHGARLEFTLHDLKLGPVDEFLQRNLPVEVRYESIDNDLTSNEHTSILQFLMA